MRIGDCLGRATEARRLSTRVRLDILIATLIQTTSRANSGITNTLISSSEDGIPDMVMATQMVMTSLITGIKQQERRTVCETMPRKSEEKLPSISRRMEAPRKQG
jgi:hypothetical protein